MISLKMKKLVYANEFFLNKTNIDKIINNICFINDYEKKEKPVMQKKSDDVFVNDNEDKLFWFWYIFHYSYENYEMLGKNTYQKEMKIKTGLVEMIHKQKKELKKFKMKVNDIEQDILYSKKISIKSFMIILYLHKINLVYYTDNIYYENILFDKTIVIYYNKDNNLYEMKKNENIETIKNEKFLISSLDKKIKAISKYKADEIKIIAKKLGIEIMKSSNKTFTKKELYEKIIQKIS